MSTTRVLTGITTTGSPHLGNYVGAIRPAIAASRRDDVESFFFLADYHALVKCEDPQRVQRSTLEIAASWLACGLDPDRVYFYRQSDIPEIPELTWILACSTGKGLLNRAHAYKAAVDANSNDGDDADAGISMGLYSYPVLMAADILAFNAHRVPVGRDQIQHIEMARDIAARVNHRYGEHFVLPEAQVDEQVATLPGLDGRKMSKSYDNTIPLWLPDKALKGAIARIVTDSRAPGESKDSGGSALFEIYRAFASPEDADAMRQSFADGIGWGEAKQKLYERIDSELRPMRERYYQLIARPGEIEEILRFGGRKARALAIPLVADLRMAVGIAPLFAVRMGEGVSAKSGKDAQPRFVSFRDGDAFKFKLLDEHGEVVLESVSFPDPQTCGRAVGVVKKAMASRQPLPQRAVEGQGFELDAADGALLARGDDVARYAQVAETMAVLLA